LFKHVSLPKWQACIQFGGDWTKGQWHINTHFRKCERVARRLECERGSLVILEGWPNLFKEYEKYNPFKFQLFFCLPISSFKTQSWAYIPKLGPVTNPSWHTYIYIYIYIQIIVWIFTGRVRFQDLFVLLLVHWFSKVLFSYSTSWFILFCMLVGGIRIFSNFWGLGFKTFELWFFFILDFMEFNVSWCNCWIRVQNLLIGNSLVFPNYELTGFCLIEYFVT
jgi:hypothetical protein